MLRVAPVPFRTLPVERGGANGVWFSSLGTPPAPRSGAGTSGTDGLAPTSLPSTAGTAAAPASGNPPAKALTDCWTLIDPNDSSYRTPAGGTHCGTGGAPLPGGGEGGGAGEQTPVLVRSSVMAMCRPAQLTTCLAPSTRLFCTPVGGTMSTWSWV